MIVAARGAATRLFIFVTIFVDVLGYGIVIPLVPLLVAEQAAGGTVVGIIGALYALSQAIGGPLLSSLSDRVGRRPILLLCLLGTTLAYLLLGLANSLPLLLLAILLDGLTGANLSTAQAYVADSTAPERRSEAFGMVGAAFGLGMMIGPALGGFLSQSDLHTPALAAAALAFGNLLLGFVILPESLPPQQRQAASLRLPGLLQLQNWLRWRQLQGLLLTMLLVNLAFAGLQSNFPLFSKLRFNWEAGDNAYFYAFVGVCAVITQALLLGRLRQLFGDQRLAQLGIGLMALHLPLIALAPAGWMLYPLVALLALGSNLAIPGLTSLLSAHVEAGAQGRLMATQQVSINLGLIVGPLMAGLAFDYLGAGAPYLVGGLVAILALHSASGSFRRTSSALS